jgi:phosphoadenosine phosphosulfate reductase
VQALIRDAMAAPALSPHEVSRLNERFATTHPTDIIRWAVETFRPEAAITSSFGTDSAAILHMAVQADPNISVRTVDTGFLFPETLAHTERVAKLLKLNLAVYRTSLDGATIARLKREHAAGTPIDDRYCCGEYKKEATQRALKGLRCWIAGLMREESVTRKDTPFVEVLGTGMVKVAPIAAWSSKQIHAYMTEHKLPYHPLWEQGYTSIGCALHTQKPIDPNDPRSGRWAGQSKTECGIHDIGKPPAAT